jgi:hypothetical protein
MVLWREYGFQFTVAGALYFLTRVSYLKDRRWIHVQAISLQGLAPLDLKLEYLFYGSIFQCQFAASDTSSVSSTTDLSVVQGSTAMGVSKLQTQK